MRRFAPSIFCRLCGGVVAVVACAGVSHGALAQAAAEREAYENVPMPPAFQVIVNELEGPVFADAQGHTLYDWPRLALRNGQAGENKGTKPQCYDVVDRETVGFQSPWPPGLLLPDLDTRLSCAKVWPPALAAANAKPVGDWTIVARTDGTRQWAYQGYPVYTSILDKQPGDVNGGTKRLLAGEGPVVRFPIGPPALVPSRFTVVQTFQGRMLVTDDGFSVYALDGDQPGKSICEASCLTEWEPVLAPQSAQPRGEWTISERSPGVRQWVFRGGPLYSHILDRRYRSIHSLQGSDVPGWHNVYTQHAPNPPKEFTVQDALAGQVLADAHGRTLYIYYCGDDSIDQLACDHPDTTQALRFIVCGHGDPQRCLETFPPVLAAPDAKSDNHIWTTIDIDPKTGHRAAAGQPGVLHVWAYRDRPVYTFVEDKKPGDIRGNGWGEFEGARNGFKAFWLRDDFSGNAG
jgi:predicted lipoprotein with Yx(FWY)xxD motif